MLNVRAVAPSNIAIVKYMGKLVGTQNLPENPSLSMTLDAFQTEVSVRANKVQSDSRFQYVGQAALSENEIERMHRHFLRLAPQGLELEWTSKNSFPKGVGIASSASAFAAATLAVRVASAENPTQWLEQFSKTPPIREEVARQSRVGSGSSCRSFHGPWVLWKGESVTQVPSALPELGHRVLLVSSEQKKVSSSEAHERVKTSKHWKGRVERATSRVASSMRWLGESDFESLCQMAWEEFQDMHLLFETCDQAFSYRTRTTLELLDQLKPRVQEQWLVTMDAGPNIHVIAKPDQLQAVDAWLETMVQKNSALQVMKDHQGNGAQAWI